MNKILVFGVLSLLLLLTVFTAGCVDDTPVPPNPEKTTYIVGIDGAYPPFTYLDADGNAAGFDVDSMKWIAQEKGLDVTFRAITWTEIIPSLQKGYIDIIYSGMTITPERSELIDFTEPYWDADQGVAVRADSEITLEQFLEGNVVIGVERRSSAEDWLSSHFDNFDEMVADGMIQQYGSFPMSIMGLQNKDCDAVIFDDVSIEDYIKDRPLKVIGVIDTGEQYGVAVQKGDTELLRIMNEGIAELKASPKWDELVNTHLVVHD